MTGPESFYKFTTRPPGRGGRRVPTSGAICRQGVPEHLTCSFGVVVVLVAVSIGGAAVLVRDIVAVVPASLIS